MLVGCFFIPDLWPYIRVFTSLFCFFDIYETVEHDLSPKKSMSPVGFDPRTSHIVSHCSTKRGRAVAYNARCPVIEAQLVELEWWLTMREVL